MLGGNTSVIIQLKQTLITMELNISEGLIPRTSGLN